MEHVVLVIHLIVTLAMIILIMLQRSEGGGLGIGSSGGMGNFASAQATGNVLTKMTTYAGIIFFVTSIILAVMAARGGASSSILDAAGTDVPAITAPAATDATPSAGGKPSTDPTPGATTTAPDKVKTAAPVAEKAPAANKESEPPTVPIAK